MPTVVADPGELIEQNERLEELKGVSTGSLTIITTENYSSNYLSKPNAIVRPLRRRDPDEEGSLIRDLESQIIEKLSEDAIKKKHNEFTRELDVRLSQKIASISRGTELKRQSSKDRDGSAQETANKRPLFITTVPRGVFLDPQPIIRDNVPKKRHVYAYASRPRVISNTSNNNRILKQQSFYSNPSSIFNRSNKDSLLTGSLTSSITESNASRSESRYFTGSSDLQSGIGGIKLKPRENQPSNLMFDRRVIRGSNFAVNSQIPVTEVDSVKKEDEAKRRQLLRKRQSHRHQRGIIGTPPPVRGRKHETIQTEKYLEELCVRPSETTVSCQTDLFLQRPPSPPYVSAKIGVDVSTEISEGELFDFDSEVQPILEALVGQTLEQALVEVVHEEEIAELREQQHKLLAIREAERAELRRMEDEEKRIQGEKERRRVQDEVAKIVEKDLKEKTTAAKLLKGHISQLLPSVLENIESVRDAENKEELQKKLAPWLAQEVAEEIGQMIDSKDLLLEIVKEVLAHRAEQYSKCDEPEQDEL